VRQRICPPTGYTRTRAPQTQELTSCTAAKPRPCPHLAAPPAGRWGPAGSVPTAIAGHTQKCAHPKPAAVHPKQSVPSPLYPFQSLLSAVRAVNARQGRSCHAAQAPFILAGHPKGSQVPATLLPRKAGAQSVVPSAQPSSALPQLQICVATHAVGPRPGTARPLGPQSCSSMPRRGRAPHSRSNTDGAASCRRPRPQPQRRPERKVRVAAGRPTRPKPAHARSRARVIK